MPNPNNSRGQSGFSIVELLVVFTVMLVITTSVFSLMKDSSMISLTTFEMTDAQQSLRTAHEYINRDLVLAGDRLRGISNICVRSNFVTSFLTKNAANTPCGGGTVNLPLIQSDNNVPANTVVPLVTPTTKVRSLDSDGNAALTDRINIIQIDSSFAPITVSANAIPASGGSITIPAADLARVNVGEIYFITSTAGTTFGTVTGKNLATGVLSFATGDVYGLNQAILDGPISTVSDGGLLPASIMRMRIIQYFINDKGLLIKRVFGVGGGVGHFDSVIAEHVANLQFRYILNTNDDGTSEQPVSQLSTPEQQVSVRQVEITVITETVHKLANKKRQPVSMTTTTSVRNLQFLETQQP